MITVPVKTRNGVYRVMRTRVPRTSLYDLYRKAEAEAPELLAQFYTWISQDLASRPRETAQISTDLISRIPADWPYHEQWLQFSSSEADRRSLFEQVLWTYFFDLPEEETWETSWPSSDQSCSKYVRLTVTRKEDFESTRVQGLEITTRSVASSREIEIASAAPASPVPQKEDSTDQLRTGAIVKINRGLYEGLTGEITKIEVIDGFDSVTVKLSGDDERREVPGFPTYALDKL